MSSNQFNFNTEARVSNLKMLKNTMLYKSSLGIKDKTWKNWAESIDNIIKNIDNKEEKKISKIGNEEKIKIKKIIKEILKNLKKNNLKKFKYEAFGGLIQKEKRIRKLLEKIIDFLNKINGKTRQNLFNDNKLSITRNLKRAYNTAIKTNQFIASEGQLRSSTTIQNSSTINLNFLKKVKKEFEQLNELYKTNIEQSGFPNFSQINDNFNLIEFCTGIHSLNNEIKTTILQKMLKIVNTDKKFKIYEFIVSYNYFINNLKEYCRPQSLEVLSNNEIKDKLKSIGTGIGNGRGNGRGSVINVTSDASRNTNGPPPK